ncbi:flagellar basal body-associated protein FliL [Helicobacter cappadocius]|uniref:Flagellar protein FliL n=1 Tax=Helicobacter cappadocius TaxID=3063998 RepID=A0AA90TEW3_9HELI|nr:MULTISPECIES: flagellar basal body-associated protein FliL [unclassified Helicobacter]MDO7252980.1 flagellar basal body-associated protein FliL [Helicobacter sp. faydin-H75]MDP2539030.1 flagellar basal body-associated protein FliL [Helicobacter sp. faydin-H76]
MAEEKEVTEEQQAPKQNKTLIFVIIGVIVFLLIIGIVAGVLLLGGNKSDDEAKDSEATASAQLQKKPNGEARTSNYLNIGPLYQMPEPFIVNLVTQSGRRYLKTSISLELSNEKLQKEVEAKSTIIQDSIIEILSSKSIEEIATTKGKDRLKDEIVNRINSFLIDGYIKNVFFTEFVIQ